MNFVLGILVLSLMLMLFVDVGFWLAVAIVLGAHVLFVLGYYLATRPDTQRLARTGVASTPDWDKLPPSVAATDQPRREAEDGAKGEGRPP